MLIGETLGPYRILAKLGEGGMGEVYRARDGKLDRDVAIKVLPEALATDPERIARFEREAKTLAALNHPNIAAIYGLEHHESLRPQAEDERIRAELRLFLVMELVEGEDLAQRIARGAIPLAEALPIARQIGIALEAAHEQGIIHRDLKPANIKVRDDGTVKVLDFGLAKALAPESGVGAGAPSASMSPTLSLNATMAGVILGTAAYMAPEQARGKVMDKRADIWAFGCVLFEMLTGQRLFAGEEISDTLASVLKTDPDWNALPADTPPPIRRLLGRCLEKDRQERLPEIGTARLDIKEALSMPAGAASAVAPQPARVPRPIWKRALPVVVTAIAVGALAGVIAWTLRPKPLTSQVTRFVFTPGEGQRFTTVGAQSLAFSPDGTQFVYVANNQLYLRSLPDLEARPVPGTQQTSTLLAPAFSPDGKSIAFYSVAERAIKKIAVSGGAAIPICPVEAPFTGMTWDTSGIVFGQGGKGILRVPETGGQPAVVVAVKNGEIAASPQVLPGGDWVLFSIATAATVEGWDKAQVVVQSLKTPERRTLFSGGSDARYVTTGHIVYALGGVVLAVPFDLGHLAVAGGAVPVVPGVQRSSNPANDTVQLSISSTGSLVFIPGPVGTSVGQSDLALIDRSGAIQLLKLPAGPYEFPRVSPDGKRIAVGSDDGKDAFVAIYDVSGASQLRRLTLGGRNRVPVWAADSEHVAFQSDREGDLSIWWQRADGTTPAERLTKPEDKDTAHVPESWSPDGKTLLFSAAKGSSYSLEALSLPDKNVTPFGGVQSLFPTEATFSPDGRWVAYSVGAAGASAGSLFVQPFPPTGATYPISKGLGIHTTWSADPKELIYSPGPRQLVSVSVATRPGFTFGNPVTIPFLFTGRSLNQERNHDIMPDGKRFLGVVAAGQGTSGQAAAQQIQVVVNWFEELKARVPTK